MAIVRERRWTLVMKTYSLYHTLWTRCSSPDSQVPEEEGGEGRGGKGGRGGIEGERKEEGG